MNLKKSKLFKEAIVFDVSKYLTDDETIFEYLKLSFKSNDERQILMSIKNILKAKRLMSKTDKKIKVNSNLYRSLLKDDNPSFITVYKFIQSLGLKLCVVEKTK